MQADAEAAAADARTDTGTAEVIRGVGSVALGVFAIVASGEVLAKNVAFTIGKEVVVDELSDKAVGYTTSHIVETWGLNQTQSTLVQMGLSAVATIGTGKLEDTLTESKFASQMSPDDAARYNAWSDKCQYGTPNRYPGLSEIDVALWNKANVKVDEAVALSKIDAEAFAKLKKVEFKENFDDARHSVNRVDNVVEGGSDVPRTMPQQLTRDGQVPAIGKMKDLNTPGSIVDGEFKVADYLPDMGNPKDNWHQNSGILRSVMNEGVPIKDVSMFPMDNAGFLGAERNLLQSRGWTYLDGYWYPPK